MEAVWIGRLVLTAGLAFGAGYAWGRGGAAVELPPAPTSRVAERADSPFVRCIFMDGGVIADKRLRKESAGVEMMWAGLPYVLKSTGPGGRIYQRKQ